MIAQRAEANTGWILAAGVFCAFVGLATPIGKAWIAVLLMASLFSAELSRLALQALYYRRGW